MDQRTPLEVTTWGRYESFVELAKPVMMMHAYRRLLNRDAIIGSVRCALHRKREDAVRSCDLPPWQALPRFDNSSLHPACGPPWRQAKLTGITLSDEVAGSTSQESDDTKRRSLAATIPHPHTKVPRTVSTTAVSSLPTFRIARAVATIDL